MPERDPQHPVLADAWRYDIEAVVVDLVPEDGSEPRVDLRLSLGRETVELRFWSPRQLSIEMPLNGGDLEILDLSARGMEVQVRVASFEDGSHGGVQFYARAVERLYRVRGAG